MSRKMLHGIQIILARSLLGLGRKEVEGFTGVSISSIRKMEREKYKISQDVVIGSFTKLKNFFEKKGIEFVDEKGKVGLVISKKDGEKLEKKK